MARLKSLSIGYLAITNYQMNIFTDLSKKSLIPFKHNPLFIIKYQDYLG